MLVCLVYVDDWLHYLSMLYMYYTECHKQLFTIRLSSNLTRTSKIKIIRTIGLVDRELAQARPWRGSA